MAGETKILSYFRKSEGTTGSGEIKQYFLKEREEETGDPAAGLSGFHA